MTKKNLNFITNGKAVLILCLILAIASNFFYFNIFTNAKPLSVIKQNSDSITFGVSVEKESIPSNINLVSGPWILSTWSQYNTDWLSKFSQPDNINKTPYLYLYIAAGKARSDWNLEDCNIGVEKSRTLCYRGAEYLRNNREHVNQAYINTANNIKKIYGTNREIALHIEPDFYQYTSSDQLNGGLSFSEATKDMNLWTDSIKQILPNASLVMDVSPWNSDLKNWSSNMKNFDYAGIVGKPMSPYGDGTSPVGVDGKSYAKISQDTGKKLILDDSHGVGGYWLPFDYDWSNKSLAQERLKDGVVAVLLPPNDLGFLNGMVKSTQNQTTVTATSSNSSTVAKISSSLSSVKEISNVITIKNEPIKAPISKPNIGFSQIVCSNNSVDISLVKGDSWQSGFVTNVRVKNNSPKTINSWDINLITAQGQNINNSWNLKRDGNYITPNSQWNSKIEPGQELNVGGFTVTHSGFDSIPTLKCGTY